MAEVKAMELKTNTQAAKTVIIPTKERTAKAEQLITFFGDVKAEFKKIAWTEPNELRSYTKIVVATTFIFGMGIYFMDVTIQTVLNSFGYILRLISG